LWHFISEIPKSLDFSTGERTTDFPAGNICNFRLRPPCAVVVVVLLGEMLLLPEWMGCFAAGLDVGQGGELVLLVHLLQVDGDVDLCVLSFSPPFPLLIFAICSF